MDSLARKTEQSIVSLDDLVQAKAFDIYLSLSSNFVVMRVHRGVYTIIAGQPADTKRHGLWQVGSLNNPPKVLLKDALARDSVQIAQNARDDPRTAYMRAHVIAKGINSVAVLPVKVKNGVSYLVVFDKMAPLSDFTEAEIDLLKNALVSLRKAIKKNFNNGFNPADALDEMKAQAAIVHVIRNPIMIIGGFARRLLLTLPPDSKESQRANIIQMEATRLEKELSTWDAFLKFCVCEREEPREIELADIANVFAGVPKFVLTLGPGAENQKTRIIVFMNSLKFILEQIKIYLLENAKNEVTITLELDDDGLMNVKAISSCFEKTKRDYDPRLVWLQALVRRILDGDMKIGHQIATISFPT